MNIISENIRSYIINTLSLKDNEEITLEDMNRIKRININRLNYNLKEALFNPVELSYLRELEQCSFSGFLINDEIKESIEKLEKLRILEFDHCRMAGNKTIKSRVTELKLNYSDVCLVQIFDQASELKRLMLKNTAVDAKKISELKHLMELSILNCDVINEGFLTQMENLKKIKIVGSEIDDKRVIETLRKKVATIYSKEECRYIR